jgi:gluconokinase
MKAIIFMGVSGCGKTTCAAQLAAAWGGGYIEGDDLHDDSAIAKMAAGIPLTDADRWPWLDRLAAAISTSVQPAIATCSALKPSYRDRLRHQIGRVGFIHLDVPRADIEKRLAQRRDHFMPAALLESQFQILDFPYSEPDILHIHYDDLEWQSRIDDWLIEVKSSG